jgi:hypothetical protein
MLHDFFADRSITCSMGILGPTSTLHITLGALHVVEVRCGLNRVGFDDILTQTRSIWPIHEAKLLAR